ncbi:saccharopine dehydrogenase [Halobacteriovorax sp. Y22]|uniref:saccharopine dehydrogenase n=1 Tax=Halobacteriovorax sp. Y22 TaxID=2505978 RepID=UPI001080950A|nr:saccharopine dehydrogenase [Halobacteriovorax sp. Y22]TGD48466.1 saccharopine dehydrogenase [Halobacteriovorax sp. Y22]
MIYKTLWLRHETKPFEQRSALTPEAAKAIRDLGHEVIIERSPSRIFKDEEFEKLGFKMMPSNSWINMAPKNAYILGLKELDAEKFPLTHRHIHFAHVYKGQNGANEMLDRFIQGDGKLFDLEYLVDENGKRIAAFGRWAGFVGAAIGLKNWIAQQRGEDFNASAPLNSYENQFSLINEVAKDLEQLQKRPRAVVIGHRGRCGIGAKQFLKSVGVEFCARGREETSVQRPIRAILDYDILINCTLNTTKAKPFLDLKTLEQERNLSVISDVSCDPTGPCNPLPIYDDITTIDTPTTRVDLEELLEVTAIDHLPSLLPRESTEEYVEQLLPHIIDLLNGDIEDSPWERALEVFYAKTIELGLEKRLSEEPQLLM